MQETLAQLFGYIWGVWRYRWIALTVAWFVAVAGWAVVWKMPDAYVASAKVFVDTNSVLRPLLRGLAITPNIDQRVSMMSRTLLSRPNLEKLARMTDLDLTVTTEAQKQALIKNLTESISLQGTRGNASLYNISVKDQDRDTARKLVESLITIFIESSLGDNREASSGAQTFLDDQIREYERRLLEAENRLARFKQQNMDVVAGSGGDYYTRLEAARADLSQSALLLRESENRRDELQRQLDGEEPVFLGQSGTTSSPVDARIQGLQSQLDSLLLRYTELHPEVRQLRGLIDELQAEREQEYELLGAGGFQFGGSLQESPVYQGMRSMLAETEASVAELRVRVAEHRQRVEELTGKVSLIPEVEAKLKQLDRDYAVVSGQHQELLQRRESAKLSQDVEDTAGDVSFRVIDPPFVPLEPNEPNKLLLNAGVLLVSLGAGVVVALLLVLVNPVISDAHMLITASGFPLLGTVTYAKPDAEVRKDNWSLAAFSTGLFGLFALFGLVAVNPMTGLGGF